jgi:PAS domain S-box-containing protein
MTTLHAELERFNSLVEASPMPTAIYKGENKIISSANAEMLRLWGKDASVIGKPLHEALPELDGQPFHALLDQVYITGGVYHAKEGKADLVIDGRLQTFYFNFTYKALKDAAGQTGAIINTATDVTELVLTRGKIAETEEQLSFALFSAGIGTWDLDPIYNTVRWDARCRELFGFCQEGEILYEDVLSCIHPDDKEFVNAAVLEAINPENKGQYDIRYRTISQKEKELRWVHCKGKAYFNADGRAYRFAGTAQDITHEVRSRRREQQLLSLVNNNSDNMSVSDLDGHIMYMNQAAKNLFGVDAEIDITRLETHHFYLPEEMERYRRQIIKEIDPDKGWTGTVRIRNIKTNEIIPCYVNYMLIRDPETGEVIGRGATSRDLRPEIKAKAELRRLATIVDISEDFCNYSDLQGNTIYLNEAGKALIGVEEASGINLYHYHSIASSRLIREEIMGELLKKHRWSGRLELLHQQTGEIIPIHKQLFIIFDDLTGEPNAIAGIARDLRPELNARKKLEISEYRLARMIMTAPMGMTILKGKDFIIEMANQPMLEIWNRNTDEIIGKRLLDVFPELHDQPFPKLLESVLTTGEPLSMPEIEADIATSYGRKHLYIDFKYSPLFDTKGDVEGVMVAVTDITDIVMTRKSLEESEEEQQALNEELSTTVEELAATNEEMLTSNEELAEAHQHLREILSELGESESRLRRAEEMLRFSIEAANIGTWFTDIQTGEFVPSASMKEFFGYHPDEEMSYAEALTQISAEHRDKVISAIRLTITTGDNLAIEFPISGYHDQKMRWVRTIGKVESDSDGGLSRFSGVIYEITEQKQDEIRKNDFIAMVSHELKTPLTSLKGYMQLLKAKNKNNGDGFTIMALEKGNAQVTRMTAMINGFLNVSRLESGKIHLNKQTFLMNELISEIVEEFRLTVSSHKILVSPCAPIPVNADSDKIGQVINNFLSNAVKYSPSGKNIAVLCQLVDGAVQLSVKDEGMGIRPADIEKLFDRFYRVENEHEVQIAGFGIGLYLCAEIIRRHDGNIWVESEPEKGSTFYFNLPYQVSPPVNG